MTQQFENICYLFLTTERRNYDALKKTLTPELNEGVFKHHTRLFIKRDDIETVKVLYTWSGLKNQHKWSFLGSVILHDACECFEWVASTVCREKMWSCLRGAVAHKIAMKLLEMGDCGNFRLEDTLSNLTEILQGSQFMQVYAPVFIKMFELGVPYSYADVIRFVNSQNREVVTWLLERVGQPTDEQVECIHSLSYSQMKELSDHSTKYWKKLPRRAKNIVDKERLKREDFYIIVNSAIHMSHLPIYLTKDILKKAFPHNIWLLQNEVECVKLIEGVKNSM